MQGLDTPTLLGIWETGPYLHDGSAATLMDVITTANPQDRHGNTSQLTEQERNQLVAFLLQLDSPATPGRIARGAAPRFSAPLSILKTGGGWLFSWDASGVRKAASLRIFDASGVQVAHLRPDHSADPRRLVFRWEKPGARPGIYMLHLSKEGGSMNRRVFLTP